MRRKELEDVKETKELKEAKEDRRGAERARGLPRVCWLGLTNTGENSIEGHPVSIYIVDIIRMEP